MAKRSAKAMSLTTSLTTAPVRLPVAAATLLVALGLQGCVATSTSTNSSPAQASSGSAPAQPELVVVGLGVVQNVRSTQIAANGTQPQPSGFGSSGTGSGNDLAGGAVGGSQSSLVTGEVGIISGAVASNAIESGVAIRDGLQITVRLDSGELRAIDQQTTGETFQAGDRVRVLSGAGVTRVTH